MGPPGERARHPALPEGGPGGGSRRGPALRRCARRRRTRLPRRGAALAEGRPASRRRRLVLGIVAAVVVLILAGGRLVRDRGPPEGRPGKNGSCSASTRRRGPPRSVVSGAGRRQVIDSSLAFSHSSCSSTPLSDRARTTRDAPEQLLCERAPTPRRWPEHVLLGHPRRVSPWPNRWRTDRDHTRHHPQSF